VSDSDVPECVACGACCHQQSPDAVPLFQIDLGRFEQRDHAHTRTVGAGVCMSLLDGRCVALVVDALRPTYLCAIYDRRPDACRAFERGGPACREARARRLGSR
jgi:Fe-S-cluster containining protein